MSNLKIGVLVDSFKLGIKDGLAKAAEVGAKGVQMYAVKGEMAPENMTPDRIKEVKDMVASNGLVISAICGDLGGGGFMHADKNAEKIEKSKRIMDLSLELGCNIITTHIGIVPSEENERMEIMRAACSELAEYGDSVGAHFAIETGPEEAHTLKAFIESLSGKAVGVNFDPANLVMVHGVNAAESFKILAPYVVHTHAKDGNILVKTNPECIYGNLKHEGIEDIKFFEEVPLGEGGVNFDEYLAAVKACGWEGFLTIERECGDNPVADITKAVKFLENKLSVL